MYSKLSMLSSAEQECIHEKSLELLEKIGVVIASEKTRQLLQKKGALVSGDNVRFPREMVKETLKLALHEFPMGARDEKYALHAPALDHPFTTPAGYVPFIQDEVTGQKRYVTEEDLRQLCVISDAAEDMDCFWPLMFPNEYAGEYQEFKALEISFRNMGKHIQCSSASGKLAEWQVEMAAAIVGGKDELKKNPIMSLLSAPTTPLGVECGIAEAMMVSARAGIPIIPMSLPQMTTTSPGTAAANILLANCEVLACYMIAKAAAEDARFFYSTDCGVPNLTNGAIDYENSEYLLLNTATLDMARFYGLPSEIGGTVEFKDFSTIAGFERNVYKLAMKLMSRPDVCCWFGTRESCLSSSLIDLVMDLEVYSYTKAYLRHFQLNEDTLAMDVFAEIGPRGNFLDHEHTFSHFRKEIFMKKVEKSYLFAEPGDQRKNTQEKINSILASHQCKPLGDTIEKELDDISKRAAIDLAE